MVKMTYNRSPFEIINHYSQIIPVNVYLIARDIGIIVTSDDMGDSAGSIIKPSQSLSWVSPTGWEIHVNSKDSNSRKKYTTTFLIAHYAYCRDLFEYDGGLIADENYNTKLGERHDSLAKKIAANIILPSHAINLLYDGGMRNITDFAKKFDVTENAMKIMLLKLYPLDKVYQD